VWNICRVLRAGATGYRDRLLEPGDDRVDLLTIRCHLCRLLRLRVAAQAFLNGAVQMNWWRRTTRTDAEQSCAVVGEVSPTLVGFADENPYLYEFDTSSGEHIFLHDTECTVIKYQPVEQRLTICFDFGDTEFAEGSPTNARVVFTMDGVLDFECFYSVVDGDYPAARGQVCDFVCRDSRLELSLMDLQVFFTASRIECSVTRHEEQ
jgi:hypothetical protein